MTPKLVSLSDWISSQYRSYSSIPPLQQKEETAHSLGCGISTLYRWLKDGTVFIEDLGDDESGECGGVIIWEMKKHVES